ncbi:MAG TPA: GAF domain-containing protein, partial [Ktedonobacterales bacterium]|nr:GAF domain-containing protein [Ktedonobacterales bacterium]
MAEESPEGGHGHLVIHEYETTGELAEGGLRRWRATEGITGKAYTQRATEYHPDVTIGDEYIPFFAGVRSEVAAPLRIGDSVLGVLDVESNRPHHFTSDYVQWVDFLAEQAAFALATIDRAVKTHLEITLADLSQRIDKGIDDMRRRTEVRHIVAGELDARAAITKVRDARNDLVRVVIDTLLPLTGSWVGRFLIALNAYSGDGDDINVTGGRLFYLVSTDQAEETNAELRFFPLTEGVSGKAFQEQRQIVFNDLKSRPDEYFDANPARDSLSGIFLPVWEGTRISGILNIESAHAQAFTPEIIRAFQIAADLASKIVTTARLRILVLLRQQLREFETVILRLSSADVTGFMAVALANAAELSSIDTGWGTVMMLSQPFPAGPPTEDQRFAVTYAPGASAAVAVAEDQSRVTYPIFVEAMRTKRPVLVLDAWAMGADQTADSPWTSHEVRSIICVPLLRPPEGGQERPAGGESAGNRAGLDDRESVGVLALAHRNPAEFSEYDKEMLSLFAESVIQGLKNIKLLEARKELMDRLRHDMSRAVQPLTHYVDGAHEAIADALAATDLQAALGDVRDVRDATTRIASLLELVVDLANWFLDLSNDDLRPERDTARGSAQEVIASAQGSLTALARQYGHQLVWDVPPVPPIVVEGGERRARLIRAALFQYIDNALKYGNA